MLNQVRLLYCLGINVCPEKMTKCSFSVCLSSKLNDAVDRPMVGVGVGGVVVVVVVVVVAVERKSNDWTTARIDAVVMIVDSVAGAVNDIQCYEEEEGEGRERKEKGEDELDSTG